MNGDNPQVPPEQMRDPSRDVCPNYDSADCDAVREAMIANGTMTAEQAATTLRAGWQAGHDRKLAAWQAHQQELNEAEEEH